MTNAIQLFTAQDNSVVSYENKKGDQFSVTPEGALFKGGAALRAYKDMAKASAFHKAENGKYRAASDILGAAFPSMAKAFEKFIGLPTWQSKTTMALYLDKLEAMRPTNDAKGFTKKQLEARDFIQLLRGIKSLECATDNAFVVEA
jgi:hypothetical protein